MRKRRIWLRVVATLIGTIFTWGGYRYYQLVKMDSRITLEHLQGKTPDQVREELGNPRFPRSLTDPRNAEEYVPFRYEYAGPWDQEYAIIFEHNRVVKVVSTRK